MRREIANKIITSILSIAIVFGCFISADATASAAWGAPVSKDGYAVELKDDTALFICNSKSAGNKVGTQYYMTYKVDKVSATSIEQTGVIGTNYPDAIYPYSPASEDGLYNYNVTWTGNPDIMLREGYIYVIRFTITKDGYDYEVAWGKSMEDTATFFRFAASFGEVKNPEYFGIYIASNGLKGKISNVHCYDANGNDLGVKVRGDAQSQVLRERPLSSGLDSGHSYEIILKKNLNKAAICSAEPATTSKVYMEYTVESSSSKLEQNGILLTTAPKAAFPYESGCMVYNWYRGEGIDLSNRDLLEPGAKYFITIEYKEGGMDYIVQKSINGKHSQIVFSLEHNIYSKEFVYVGLWLNGTINAVLKDVQIYDAKGNSLGVSPVADAKVIHYGDWEDYSGCEALYYSEENETLYAMYADKTIKRTVNCKTKKGTYRIDGTKLTIDIGEKKTKYDYLYQQFTAKDGKVYRRLHDTKLIFDTGAGSAVETQVLNVSNGYTPTKPKDPTLEGKTFVGWYTIEGEEFEFDKVVASSQTVYAKWDEIEYTALDVPENKTIDTNILYMAGAIVIVIGAIVGGVLLVAKGRKKKDESKEC